MNKIIYPIGTKVHKKSGKPFLSTYKVNTIKDIIDLPNKKINGIPVKAYTFIEDDSIVECSICYKYENTYDRYLQEERENIEK